MLIEFTPVWEHYANYHTLYGYKQRLPAHVERSNAVITDRNTELFFHIQLPKKQQLTAAYKVANFGVLQTRISHLMTTLLAVLAQSLADHAPPFLSMME